MVLALYSATVVQAVRRGLRWPRAAAHVAVTCALLGALGFIGGYYGSGGTTLAAQGFGRFSLNLASPFTSSLSAFRSESWDGLRTAAAARSAWPFFAGARPDATGGQYYEGFGYLGIGLLFLCVLNAPFALRNAGVVGRGHWPLLLVLGAATLFALSNAIHLGDTRIVAFSLPPLLEGVTAVFRSSGRFFWLVAYALLVAATILTLGRFGPGRGLALLALAAALQVFDTLPLQRAIAVDARHTDHPWPDLDAWASWLVGLDRVYIVPSHACGDPDLRNAKLTLQYHVARVGPIPTNSVYAARIVPACGDEIAKLVKPGDDARVGWVFFADGQGLPEVERLRASPGTTCRSISGLLACTRERQGG
jgi:hypothetical protein